MKNNLMWPYLIHLSEHMWADALTPSWFKYLEPSYSENNMVDFAVWDDTIKFLAECKYTHVLIDVGDAVKYERRPEISAPNAWAKDFLKKKLDEIRALGMKPIPKLNFSTCHDTWLKKYARMTSTEEYYAATSDCIAEVAELFDSPEYFHLGFDEEIPLYQVNNGYEMCVTRGKTLWWHDPTSSQRNVKSTALARGSGRITIGTTRKRLLREYPRTYFNLTGSTVS